MAAIGHPLMGDGKYGVNREEKRDGYKYQALYAYKLHFEPTGEENLLSYLEGKTFSLDRSEIWFLN
jgi:23S rRNA pseudouridine955/2504/2580 synthase